MYRYVELGDSWILGFGVTGETVARGRDLGNLNDT